MNFKEIADELVAGCREGRNKENLDKLYSDDAVSVESVDYSGMGREANGLDAIRAKQEWWEGAHDVTHASVSDPFVHGDDRFAVIFEVKGTVKESGDSFDMREVAIYHVADGKIVREEFFY
ncbi:nuclear transport factor 2 family protein [Ruegeria sp. Ofav3-42]|uniref:nuclear transport factor 2 family protein n=1 Tax=Ruegeria sp. Ofav3-42 TaxID=2917759 RepID=UPI001EF4B347|nr:nuclear transport factor 2 family protein [Ruegeria sp. Ofav3-42]MCG7518076.1 nuclear transport factor 2 family protein [Ruegeria sp. Ofav3-42]